MTDEQIKVLSTIPIAEPWIEKIKQISPRLQVIVSPVEKAEEIPPETWETCEVLYTYRILPKPEHAPRLRWVQVHRSSLEHILSHPLLECEDIRFTSSSGAHAPAAAEFILTALLAMSHQSAEIVSLQRKGDWDTKRWRQVRLVELRSSTVGIIGYGSVGRELTRLLQPLEVKVLASKLNVMHPEDKGYVMEGKGDPEGLLFHRLYPPQAIRSMLKQCDFLVICAPLTDKTRNLINKETLESLKPGAVLVSISDSNLVSLEALANALAEKKIRGAVLDSYETAPPPPDHPIWKHANAILSPRIAWRSEHNDERALAFFSQNVRRYLEGGGLLNRFDPERGY